jgi:hypothetical protein
MKCVACNSSYLQESIVPRAAFIVERAVIDKSCYSYKCEACGTTFSHPRYTETQMNLIYLNYRGIEYDKMRAKHEPNYQPHVENSESCQRVLNAAEYMLQPYLKEPRILDVGGFDGLHTPLRHIAAAHHVLDPFTAKLKAGMRVDLPEPPYDLVVLSNLLEHVSNPYEFLLDWIQHSSKMIYLEVPLANLRRPPSHIHEHQIFFTVAGMSLLLERARLRLLDLRIRQRQILIAAKR